MLHPVTELLPFNEPVRFSLVVDGFELAIICCDSHGICKSGRIGIQYPEVVVRRGVVVVVLDENLHALDHIRIGITTVSLVEIEFCDAVHG